MRANPLSSAVARLTLGTRIRSIGRRAALYAGPTDPARVRALQLEAFNRVWAAACARYAFYRDWRARHGLPEALADIGELRAFPVLRKAEIQPRTAEILAEAAPCGTVSTGGSTGEPTRFPRAPGDTAVLYGTMYLARGWWGVRPGDPMVHVWGHGHLFGRGLKGRANVLKRAAMDWLIGAERLSAYRLGEPDLDRYLGRIAAARPGAAVYGYTSAVRRLALRAAAVGRGDLAGRLRAVILSGETVEDADVALIGAAFGCPVVIEYGMAEIGNVAYSTPGSDRLRFLWDANYAHLGGPRGDEAVLTSLQPLRFPLVNYGSGDAVEADPALDTDGAGGLLRCRRVLGRTNDTVDLPLAGGRTVTSHSMILVHTIKTVPGLRSFEVRQRGRGLRVGLLLDGRAPLEAVRERVLRELRREFPDLDAAALEFAALERETLTVAGKQRFIVREAA